MLKWTFAVALAAAAAGPSFAQKTDLPDRPLKQTKAFDGAAIPECIAAVKQSGECTVTYIVGVNGKAKTSSRNARSRTWRPTPYL